MADEAKLRKRLGQLEKRKADLSRQHGQPKRLLPALSRRP